MIDTTDTHLATEASAAPSRRQFVGAALAIGAVPAWAGAARVSAGNWREDRSCYPQGVASGDPTADSVILWTRYAPPQANSGARLMLEVATDERFARVIVTRRVAISGAADGTCRVLVGGLKASTTYWYRFTDSTGAGSRVGRTRTAPALDDARAVRFAFVSCQNITMGPLTAWRRMVFDDTCAAQDDQIEFVLHLGDFVYETVWYAADRPKGYFDRTLTDKVRYPTGEKHDDYHVPVTLEDYRTLYRAYLADPDLQDARARWPFVAIWDNGEFSDKGWQSLQRFGKTTIPAQTRKVAANQAWFEYLPARVRTADGSLAAFAAPAVRDVAIDRFDAAGLGVEPNNIAAIDSLIGYRAVRWGRHVDLILTDQRSYRSDDFSSSPGSATISSKDFPQMVPFEALRMIDAGRQWNGGKPTAQLQFGDGPVANFRAGETPRTLLGVTQKTWFLDRLRRSRATWKIWGNTVATFDMRADPQHLPAGLTKPWPGKDYAGYPRTDHSTAYGERAEIYDAVRDAKIGGFVTLSGDRHSFWAGYSAKALPPQRFEPVGINFVVGSISSPGMVEAFEYSLSSKHPLRALYLADRPGAAKPEPTVNLLLRHGVRTALDYAAHGDLTQAKQLADPDNAPHVAFVDMGGHGYGICTARADRFDVDFVCVPRPVSEVADADGGPLRYRVTHSAPLWSAEERPNLTRVALSGDAGLSA